MDEDSLDPSAQWSGEKWNLKRLCMAKYILWVTLVVVWDSAGGKGEMGSKRALRLTGLAVCFGSHLHELFMNTSPPWSTTVVIEMGSYSASHYSKKGQLPWREPAASKGPPRSTAARQCDSIREEENHKALTLPFHKYRSCDGFSGHKQEENREM